MKAWAYDHGAHWSEQVGDWLARPWMRLSRWCYRKWLGDRDRREALELIARGGCENYHSSSGWRCWDSPDRIKGAHYTAEAWCDACIAQDALGR